MRSLLMAIGCLGAAFIALQFYNLPQDIRSAHDYGAIDNVMTGAVAKPISAKNNKTLIWKLSVQSNASPCTTSFISDINQKIALHTANNCIEFLPQLDQLSGLFVDKNGDITLTGAGGKKLATFIESESSELQSIWPQYPLMTLARID